MNEERHLAELVRPCVFCEIVAGRAEAEIVGLWDEALAFVPLHPVTEGHVLVIPRLHVRDATQNPAVAGFTMARAAEQAKWIGDCNLITSVGKDASQTVFHLHVHVVPRHENDGLPLPWTPQHIDGPGA